jgi:hypothetical protein
MHFSKEEKAMWLEDWKRSGKSAWAYAKENGLCPQTFIRWTKPETGNQNCFVEVPAKAMPPLEYNAPEILIEKGDVRIHVPLLVGSDELRAIFGALGEGV